VTIPLRLITYNIHKGRGALGRRSHDVSGIGTALAVEACDLLLCQEVFHAHDRAPAQSAELAAALDLTVAYAANKHRRRGHHGNATLSRLELAEHRNFDLSQNSVERRGALYVRYRWGGRDLHVLNVHLSLTHRQRLRQVCHLEAIVGRLVPEREPLILAGDFNDWRRRLDAGLSGRLGLVNAFAGLRWRDAATWPAGRPALVLDRVFLRNLVPLRAVRLSGKPWRELSDHLPLLVEVVPSSPGSCAW
jgi:endonuclease/exonuclease/phosphatase family metal-dependent hydrolase